MFATEAFKFDTALENFEERLTGLIGDVWEDTVWDSYDVMVALTAVEVGAGLSEEAQEFLYNEGFFKAGLHHTDGSKTSYAWKHSAFEPVRGSRRGPDGTSLDEPESDTSLVAWFLKRVLG